MSWQIEEYKMKEMTSGDFMTLKSYTFKGKNPGPHIHLQASVHGAELQGNALILALMDKLNALEISGSITLVPLCNPYATNTKSGTYTYGRFNPVTGHNWNRNFIDIIARNRNEFEQFVKKHHKETEIISIFKDFLGSLYSRMEDELIREERFHDNIKMNLLMQKIAHRADGVLDLHTGPIATRYVYSAKFQEESVDTLLMPHALIIPDEFATAMDEASFMPWVYLKDELKKYQVEFKVPVEGFTFELGSEEVFSMKDAQEDLKGVLNYLTYKGLIKGEVKRKKTAKCLLKDYKTIYTSCGGLVDYYLAPGDAFKKGDKMATIYRMNEIDPNKALSSAGKEILAKDDGIVITKCPSSAVTSGMELYQVMTNLY